MPTCTPSFLVETLGDYHTYALDWTADEMIIGAWSHQQFKHGREYHEKTAKKLERQEKCCVVHP